MSKHTHVVWFIALAALGLGCSDSNTSAKHWVRHSVPKPEPAAACTTDNDHDGFGPACPAGEDCNDDDPNITDECYRCAHHAPGCPCSKEGDRIDCGKVTLHEG